jgi:cytochrome c oxidase cbb3-type subunit IV
MYKDILRTITGIEVFPMISLLLFVTIFAIVLVWTARLDAARLTRLASLPLDGTEGDRPAGPAASAHSRSRP